MYIYLSGMLRHGSPSRRTWLLLRSGPTSQKKIPHSAHPPVVAWLSVFGPLIHPPRRAPFLHRTRFPSRRALPHCAAPYRQLRHSPSLRADGTERMRLCEQQRWSSSSRAARTAALASSRRRRRAPQRRASIRPRSKMTLC